MRIGITNFSPSLPSVPSFLHVYSAYLLPPPADLVLVLVLAPRLPAPLKPESLRMPGQVEGLVVAVAVVVVVFVVVVAETAAAAPGRRWWQCTQP